MKRFAKSPRGMVFTIGDALFAEAIIGVREASASPILVGLSGSQGSGKSTTAQRLATRLGEREVRVVVLFSR